MNMSRVLTVMALLSLFVLAACGAQPPAAVPTQPPEPTADSADAPEEEDATEEPAADTEAEEEPTAEEEEPTAEEEEPTAEEEEPPAEDAEPAEGEEMLDSAGMAYTVPDGWQTENVEFPGFGMAMLTPEGEGDSDNGISLNVSDTADMMGLEAGTGPDDTADTVLDVMEEELESDDITASIEREDIVVDGIDGRQMTITDIEGDDIEMAMFGVVKVDDERWFVITGVGVDDGFDPAAFDEVLSSVRFYAPVGEEAMGGEEDAEEETPADADAEETPADADAEETPATPSDVALEPGTYLYTNGNEVFDVMVYDGQVWAATLGGVVVWDAASGEEVAMYTTLDGLPSVGVFDLALCDTPEPLIVAGTANGLGFFDPASETWSRSSTTEDMSDIQQTLAMGTAGEVRFVMCDAEAGQVYFDKNGLSVYNLASGETETFLDSDALVWSSIEDAAVEGDTWWIASGFDGMTVVSGGESTFYNTESGNFPDDGVSDIAVTDDGTVWLAGDEGLVRFQEGTATLYTNAEVADLPQYGGLDQVAVDADGNLWIAASSFVCQFDPASESCATTYGTDDGLVSGAISSLTADDQGNLYYSTYDSGVVAYDGDTWSNWVLDDTLPRRSVYYAVAEHDGAIWFGLEGVGVVRTDLETTEWEIIESGDDTLHSSEVRDIEPTDEGVWFLHARSLSFYDGSAWSTYTTDEGVYDGYANAIATDSQGRLWIGGDGFVSIMEDESFTTIEGGSDGLPAEVNVRALLPDGDMMWAATTGGLVRFEGDSGELVVDENTPDLPDDNIAALAKESDGTYLLATAQGLARYDGSTVTPIEGSPSSNWVLNVDDAGGIWLSSMEGGDTSGLYYYDGSTWYLLNTHHGLPVNEVRDFMVDSAGTLWTVGGNTKRGGGIFRLVPGADGLTATVTDMALVMGEGGEPAAEEEPTEEPAAEEDAATEEPAAEEEPTEEPAAEEESTETAGEQTLDTVGLAYTAPDGWQDENLEMDGVGMVMMTPEGAEDEQNAMVINMGSPTDMTGLAAGTSPDDTADTLLDAIEADMESEDVTASVERKDIVVDGLDGRQMTITDIPEEEDIEIALFGVVKVDDARWFTITAIGTEEGLDPAAFDEVLASVRFYEPVGGESGDGMDDGGEGMDDGGDGTSLDTDFPLPEDAENVTIIEANNSVNYQTNMSIEEAMNFYRDELGAEGAAERGILTVTTDTTFSMVFDGWSGADDGRSVVVQGTLFEDQLNVNVRLEEV